MEPSPTPYDIVGIPFFAYVPPTWAWILLVICGLAVYLFYLYLKKRRLLKLSSTPLDEVLSELSGIRFSAEEDPKPLLNRASLLVRRFLEAVGDNKGELSQLTVKTKRELERLCEEASSSEIRSLLQKIVEIEELRFSNVVPSAKAEELVSGLVKETRELRGTELVALNGRTS